MNTPNQEPQTQTEPEKKTTPGPAPVNPDPKTHPMHREVPVQPIHEGTDPKQPIKQAP